MAILNISAQLTSSLKSGGDAAVGQDAGVGANVFAQILSSQVAGQTGGDPSLLLGQIAGAAPENVAKVLDSIPGLADLIAQARGKKGSSQGTTDEADTTAPGLAELQQILSSMQVASGQTTASASGGDEGPLPVETSSLAGAPGSDLPKLARRDAAPESLLKVAQAADSSPKAVAAAPAELAAAGKALPDGGGVSAQTATSEDSVSTPIVPSPQANAAATAGTAANTNSVTQAQVDTPLGTRAWSHDFSEKVVWLAGQNSKSAEIQIHPAQLGPVEVRLSVGHDQQLSATFVSAHANVRDAIESALPRLREMFADSGINLGNVSVGAESFAQQQQQQQAQGDTQRSTAGGFGAEASVSAQETVVGETMLTTRRGGGQGLVNTFV